MVTTYNRPKEQSLVPLRATQQLGWTISSSLNDEQKDKLLDILKEHKGALGCTIANMKGINSVDCMQYIHLDENAKPTREIQRQLNPNMKEVVRTKVLTLLDAGIIYPISDSS